MMSTRQQDNQLQTPVDRHTKAARGISVRAVILALVLIPANVYWITLTEVRWYGQDGTSLPIFVTPVFLLCLLSLANILVAHAWPRRALASGELLTIYVMLVASSALASQDLVQNLFGSIGHAERMASPYNGWRETWFRYLPRELLVFDKRALDGLYEGGSCPWRWSILKYWVGPLALWGALLAILVSMMLAMNVLIRKAWMEHERLTFPLVQLPMAMVSPERSWGFYKNRMMWAGFGIAVCIGTINGLHTLYPSLPYLTWVKRYNIGLLFPTRPWSVVNQDGIGFQTTMFPFAVGLGFFIPLDLSFSCWFFFIARKLWQVFGASMGWDSTPGAFPNYPEQASGAWLALGLVAFWGVRRHVAAMWRLAWSKEPLSTETRAESRLCRAAFLTLVGGSVALLLFSQYVGLSALAALCFFGVYFILAIAMTRVRAELGTPHEIYFVNPTQIMVGTLGVGMIGAANLTVMSTMYWFNRCYRSHPMPGQLEAFKMTDATGVRIRPLIVAIGLASIVGLASAYWANLDVTYRYGGLAKCLGFKSWTGAESFMGLSDRLARNVRPDGLKCGYTVIGAAIVLALAALRRQFLWWPFHPAGYALAVSFAMDCFWLPFLVAWMVKAVVVRYGGMKLHNAVAPLFMGLILGDFTIGTVWSIVGVLLGTQTYKIWI